MGSYVARRLLLFIPTVAIVATLVFALIRLIPGDMVTLMVQTNHYAPSAVALRTKLGLNEPLPAQYLHFIGNLVHGDLGHSFRSGRSAWSEVKDRAPVTAELGLMSLVISSLIGLPLGVLSAMRSKSVVDYAGRGLSILLLAVPNFWLATIIIVVPSVIWNLNILPHYVSFGHAPLQNLRLMVLPAVITGAASAAGIMRLTRTMLLDVARQDYVRTATAKGLSSRVVVVRHMLKNALVPVVTVMGFQVAVIMSGSVIMEQVFGLPGMGRYLLDNISQRDYPMVQAMTLMYALVVLTVNLLVDLSYGLLDPRMELGG